LSLREDNADARLTEIGRQLGCVDDARWDAFCRKRDAVSRETERLRSTWVNPRILPAALAEPILGQSIEREYSLADLLRRPHITYRGLATLRGIEGEDLAHCEESEPQVIEQIEIQLKYAGYIARQGLEVQRQEGQESVTIPADFDYAAIGGLSIEVRQKLSRQRPETVGQASRISGVTPAAVSLLLVYLKKFRRRAQAAGEEAA
jgi:tRNA uridine 5-carboxymethylaminomethyl modification enzyme